MHKQIFNFLLSFLLILVVTSYACRKNTPFRNQQNTDTTINTNGNNPTPHDTSGYSYLALGDSYTIGESVKEEERYPAQTVRLVQGESGKKISWLKYIAKTGWTTGSLLSAIYSENIKDTFDIVTLLIGVNDQYQHFDTGGYRDRFTTLLKKGIQLAGGKKSHVIVLSIPDYSVTPFASQSDTQEISRQIDLFNNINHEISNTYSITYINVTDISREALNDSTLLAFDGLHPSGKMYARWAALLEPIVAGILK